MAVFIEMKPGDTLMLGSSRIRMESKSGQRARFSIESTEDIDRIKAGEPIPATTKVTSVTSPFLKRPIPAAN